MRLREFPRPAAWYLRAALAGGAAVVLGALTALPRAPPGADLLLAAGLAAGCFTLQVRSPVLVWRGARLALHPDEGLLLAAFFVLPTPLVLLAATASSVLAQAYLRKPLLKGAFNVATHALSTAAGGASVALLTAWGLAPLQAVLAVPLVVSATNQVLVAVLLILLRREPWNVALGASLLQSIGITTVVGLMLGLLTIALHHLHPVALLLLVPAAMLGHRALVSAYHQENELTTRREVNRAAARLVGAREDEEVVQAVLRACRDAFAPLGVGIRLDGPGEPREWTIREASGDAGGTRLAEPIRDERGLSVGELWLVLSRKEGKQLALDRELVKLVASHLSLSLANARLLSSLQRSERRLRSAFDAARDPVVVMTRDGRSLYANARALHLDDTSASLERALWSALDPASAARLLAALARDAPEAAVELQGEGGDESRRYFEADLAHLPLDDGTTGVLVIARDVTERRRLEREAERHREALERSERLSALGVLVAGIAHEINNPLTYMRGNLDLALLDLEDLRLALEAQGTTTNGVEIPEMRRQLQTVAAGAARIELITKGLRGVAGARGPSVGRPIRLDRVVAGIERALGPLPPGVVYSATGTETAVDVAGEEGELRQALLNLAKNAVEAVAAEGGRVEVRLRVEAGHAVVDVVDDGPGIPPEARAKLFTPLFTTKPEKTGLGLATTYAILMNHGGTVDVAPAAARGACFTLRLPVRPAEPAGATAGPRAQLGS